MNSLDAIFPPHLQKKKRKEISSKIYIFNFNFYVKGNNYNTKRFA